MEIKTLRSCIVAEEGYTFLSIDASQIELRVLGQLSQDPQLLSDLATGDLHTATMLRMWGDTDDPDLWKSRRYKAKTGNFALVYGADEFTLARIFECEIEEAQEFMADHEEAYPRLYEWMNEVKAQAKIDGYVISIFGRIRPIPELESHIWQIKEKAERETVNTIVQGCLAPDTKVLRDDLTWVTVGSLQEGNRLIAFDAEAERYKGRKWQISTVLSTGRIKLPSYLLSFDDGTQIVASEEHPWLTLRGKFHQHWLQTKDLIVGRSRIPLPIPVWSIENSRDGGYLASAFDSEGSICQYKGGRSQGLTIQYSQSDLALQQEIERILSVYGFDYGRYPSLEAVSPVSGVWQTNIQGGFAENLRFLGQFRPIRLLNKFKMEDCSRRMFSKLSRSRKLTGKEYVGLQEVVALATSTGTYFAEGMPTHNTAVDIVKKMMLHLRRIFDPGIRLVLQVHDEIVWEVPDALLVSSIQQAGDLDNLFPNYPCNVEYGKVYGEMEKYGR